MSRGERGGRSTLPRASAANGHPEPTGYGETAIWTMSLQGEKKTISQELGLRYEYGKQLRQGHRPGKKKTRKKREAKIQNAEGGLLGRCASNIWSAWGGVDNHGRNN